MSVRSRTWEILETAKPGDVTAKFINYFMLGLIFLNVIAVIMGTVELLQSRWGYYFDLFEIFSVSIFSVEYICRIWSSVEDKRYSSPVYGRIKYALRFMTVLDLVAILPFFLPFTTTDTRAIRVFRLLRLIRILRFGRYYSTLNLFASVIKKKKEELVLTSVLMAMLLVVSACVMYYCENEAQPENFSSIPQSMWWAVATLTTVGYGDIYPVTSLGKIFSGIISILGIGMFALPTGILGAGFIEEIQKKKTSKKHCPHCGKEID